MFPLRNVLLSVFTVTSMAGSLPAAQAQTPVFTTGDNKQPYFSFAIDQDNLTGAPDRSGMNTALTTADRVFVRDGHFFRAGKDQRTNTADDQRVRLYGANLSFSTNFPSEQEAARIAKRLRKLGFNAVRLHHMDTSPGNETNPPRSLLTPAPYPTFNPVAVARLQRFIQILSQEGIYVNVNLHVSYHFRASVDQVPVFENNANTQTYGAPVHVYYPKMVQLQEQFVRQLLRGIQVKNSPALAMVEINNESSLLGAWQRREWKAAVPAAYEPELMRQWQAWLLQRYGSTDKACQAWGECLSMGAVIPLLTPTDTTYAPEGMFNQLQERIENKLRPLSQKILGPNDPGKPDQSATAKRVADFLQFLADTDRAYFNRLRTVVQEETDTQVPVTGTQMGYGGVMNFDSHAQMDYIDEHFYIDHPDYPGVAWDKNDWRMHDTPLNSTELARVMGLSFKRDKRKPYVISEFNYPFPNRQGALIQPLMAAVAAAQDWDGLFFFDFMDADTWADTPSNFTLSGDWGKYALTGQSALLFRQQQFPALQKSITLPLTAATRNALAASRVPAAFEEHLEVKYGVTPRTAMQAKIAIDVTGKSSAGMQPATSQWQSPAGTLELDAQNVFYIRTPQAKGLFGIVPNQSVTIDPYLSVTRMGTGRSFVALLVSALDNKPLQNSTRMLLSVSGAVTGTQPGSLPARPKEVVPYKGQNQWWTLEKDPTAMQKPSGARDVPGPVWMERTEIKVALSTPQKRLTVYPLNAQGQRMAALPGQQVGYQDGTTTVHLQAKEAQTSLWYEIVADAN